MVFKFWSFNFIPPPPPQALGARTKGLLASIVYTAGNSQAGVSTAKHGGKQ
jgi:hypothetical protein